MEKQLTYPRVQPSCKQSIKKKKIVNNALQDQIFQIWYQHIDMHCHECKWADLSQICPVLLDFIIEIAK